MFRALFHVQQWVAERGVNLAEGWTSRLSFVTSELVSDVSSPWTSRGATFYRPLPCPRLRGEGTITSPCRLLEGEGRKEKAPARVELGGAHWYVVFLYARAEAEGDREKKEQDSYRHGEGEFAPALDVVGQGAKKQQAEDDETPLG